MSTFLTTMWYSSSGNWAFRRKGIKSAESKEHARTSEGLCKGSEAGGSMVQLKIEKASIANTQEKKRRDRGWGWKGWKEGREKGTKERGIIIGGKGKGEEEKGVRQTVKSQIRWRDGPYGPGEGFYFLSTKNKDKQGQRWGAQVCISKRHVGFSEPSLLTRAGMGVGGPAGAGGTVSAWRKESTFKCICNISSQPHFPESWYPQFSPSSPSLTRPPRVSPGQCRCYWNLSARTSLCPSDWSVACLYP